LVIIQHNKSSAKLIMFSEYTR